MRIEPGLARVTTVQTFTNDRVEGAVGLTVAVESDTLHSNQNDVSVADLSCNRDPPKLDVSSRADYARLT